MYICSLFQVFDDKKYLAEAKSCAEVIWSRGLLRKGYGLCHGVSGNAYGFLCLYAVTLEPMYLYRAWKVRKRPIVNTYDHFDLLVNLRLCIFFKYITH